MTGSKVTKWPPNRCDGDSASPEMSGAQYNDDTNAENKGKRRLSHS